MSSNELHVAERAGFEPAVPVRVRTLSKRVPSTAQPSLHVENNIKYLAQNGARSAQLYSKADRKSYSNTKEAKKQLFLNCFENN